MPKQTVHTAKDLTNTHLRKFLSKLPHKLVAEDCWNWQGTRNLDGRGRIDLGGKKWLATHISWMLLYGDVPYGLHVMHRCNNPTCVNPFHLVPGTASQNAKDAVRDGLIPLKLTLEARELIRTSALPITQLALIFDISVDYAQRIKTNSIK